MRLPSVAALHKHLPNVGYSDAKMIRRRLEVYRKRYPMGQAIPTVTFGHCAKLMKQVECDSIAPGNNAKSPEVYYVKADDTYDQTLIWTPGRIFIGNIGHHIEQGSYA